MRNWSLLLLCLGMFSHITAQKYQLTSPDQKIKIEIINDKSITWAVDFNQQSVITPSEISMTLSNEVLGKNAKVQKKTSQSSHQIIKTNFYKKNQIVDHFNSLKLNFKGDYALEFRAYNDGVAYRFTTSKKQSFEVLDEGVHFNFAKDYPLHIPYANDPRYQKDYFQTSFEALYTESKISEFKKEGISLLPLMVTLDNNAKAIISEAYLNGYSGMHLTKDDGNSLKGVFAKYPLEQTFRGHEKFNSIVTKRTEYIAKYDGDFQFPWRSIILAHSDKELLNNDLIYKLAEPSKLKDITWIKPGKVAWDWWNNWGLTGVDFKAGVNTQTYFHYIDFAAKNGLEYIIVDDGWSNAELTTLNPEVSIPEIISYANSKGVNVILWATWRGIYHDIDGIFSKYAKMGAKGFKIDFLDRDDAEMTASTYKIAEKAAQYKLLINLHGMYKPEGLSRTYPNVINYEGVKGLENTKWAVDDDFPKYAVTAPFIRMAVGPMDYTPGAMRNATKADYRPSNANPVSQGTRAHQVAMFIGFDAPLQMLADSPSAYEKEQNTTDFIAKIPTVFDETWALDGKVGAYFVVAKRKGNHFYISAMTNWDARDLNIDFSFLPHGQYEIEIFQDGINADKNPQDYKILKRTIQNTDQLSIHLSNGGGWAAQITKK